MADEVAEGPVAATGLLIRRPPEEVFEAWVDPEITRRFWFSHGSGRLERGQTATWEWRWYGAGAKSIATAREVEPGRRLLYDWDGGGGALQVEYRFDPHPAGTYMQIRCWGFPGDPAAQARAAVETATGFTFVLAGCKAWLEQGVEFGIVPDVHPQMWAGGVDPVGA